MLEKGTMTLGVNYWASHAATRMWTQWDVSVVEQDFAALEKIGCQLLRVFPLWPDFQPVMVLRSNCARGGYPRGYAFTGERPLPETEAGRAGVDETMMERFETLADLALKHGMRLIVPLINGHMTFRIYCPPAVDGLDAFTDPESLFWQNRFVRYFVGRMKHHPAILAWELGNESNCLSVAETRAAAWNWAAQIAASIRMADPDRPVYSGMHSLQLHDRQWENRPGKWLISDQAELCGVLTTHPYQMWRSYVNCDPPNTLHIGVRNMFRRRRIGRQRQRRYNRSFTVAGSQELFCKIRDPSAFSRLHRSFGNQRRILKGDKLRRIGGISLAHHLEHDVVGRIIFRNTLPLPELPQCCEHE